MYYSSGDAFPTSGGGTTIYLVDLRYTVNSSAPITMTPPLSGWFTNGVWSGTLSAMAPGSNCVVRADDGNGHSGAANPITVLVQNDLSLGLSANPSPVAPGGTLGYTLSVTNSGPTAATGVVLTNWLPANVVLTGTFASQGTWSQNPGVVRWDVGVVPGGATATLSLLVQPTLAGVLLTNGACVARAEADGYLGNNGATNCTAVSGPAVSIADASVLEGNVGTTNLLFAVTLSAPSAKTVTVSYLTANGTASASSDYLATNGVLSFASGQTSAALAVAVLGNTRIEPDKDFYVDLSTPSNAVVGRREAVGLIVNDDGLPGQVDHFAWSAAAAVQYVGEPFSETLSALDAFNNPVTAFNGTVSLSGWRDGPSNTLLNNPAPYSSGSSYYTCGYSFTPTNSLTVTHVRSYSGTKVSIWTDTGTLLLTQPVSGPTANWTETALPTPLRLPAGTTYRVSVYAGSSYLYYSSTRPTAFPDGLIKQFYSFYGDGFPTGVSSAGWFVDLRYTPGVMTPVSPASVTLSQGVWSGSVAVQAPASNFLFRADDADGHSGWSSPPLEVRLRNDVALTVADSPRPVCVGANLTYSLGVSNLGPANATGLFVTNALPAGATYVSATASQGTCWPSGNLVIWSLDSLAGATNASATITVHVTQTGNLTNTATVYRGEADAWLGNNTATVVTPAVSLPTVSIADSRVREAKSGTTNMSFAVSLWPPPVSFAVVSFYTGNGTATAPADYLSTNGTLAFAPGETNKTLSVVVNSDSIYSSNKLFYVSLNSPISLLLGKSQATGTIIDDEPLPTLSVGDAAVLEGNMGTTNCVFTVTLSEPSRLTTTVTYSTVNGTATGGLDFLAASGTLTLPPLVTTATIPVAVIGNTAAGPDKTFYLDLSAPSNATLARREGIGTIVNDDGLPGQVDHFAWSALGATQYVGVPFSGTVLALDAFNNPAFLFNGTARFTGLRPGGLLTNTILGNVSYYSYGYDTYTEGYSFTPNTNLTVTHFRSYCGTKVSLWTDTGVLLASQTLSGSSGSWVETPLATPVTLTAGAHYRLAFYTGGGYSYYCNSSTSTFPYGSIDQGYYYSGDAFPTYTTSTKWYMVDLRYTVNFSLPATVTPTVSGPFTNGLWSGNFLVQTPFTNLWLQADDANGHSGASAPFNVVTATDLALAGTCWPPTLFVGETLNQSLTVSNRSPVAATGVVLTNILPPTLSMVSLTCSQGTWTRTGNTYRFLLGSVPPAASAQIALLATTTTPGSVTNIACLGANELDFDPSNNSLASVVTILTRPVLGCVLSGPTLRLSWSGPVVLQSSAAAAGPFVDVPGATPPLEVDTTASPQLFFRLRSASTLSGATPNTP